MVATPTVAEISDSEISRVYSPRPDSPEPDSRQGRRNPPPGVQLLDDEGSISEQVRPLDILLRVWSAHADPWLPLLSLNDVFCTSSRNTARLPQMNRRLMRKTRLHY